jgi:eukaryotic-like serine/threonine-protein kinase
MTPERWREIDDLFNQAMQIAPAQRAAWLRKTCGGDDDLEAEVARLLADDDRAGRNGFLAPPELTRRADDDTATWSPCAGNQSDDDGRGFTPRAAIVADTLRKTVSEPPAVVRARLRELPIVYIVMLGIAMFSRRVVFNSNDFTLYRFDVAIIIALSGLIALLWSRWPISLSWLKALELLMLGVLACRLSFVQYRLILVYSLRDDPMMAQLTMKNVVLLTSILILTYGLYVPKSWRRTALVVGPLALLPFATLLVLYLQYPEVVVWLGQGSRRNPDTPRVLLLVFDALILLMLAVGSTFGARALSRLRRQVVEARKLGQYRLQRRIGSGGMGEVYLAEHQLLKRPCAVKLIRPCAATDPRALARFEREVRLTATLSHPNTVDVYDYGRAEDGTYYYVMEYLRGLSLAELVERHGPLPPERAVYLLRQVCGALREAHAAGLIHRDLKPSNIFAARRGGMEDVAKLLDFGLVLPAATVAVAHLSAEGQIVGTPQYMSPEQARGAHELDERSDIYSLGAVAFYLLTGRPPFEGDNGISVLIAHARDPVTPPSQIRSSIPEDLEQVVLRCLAKDTAERFEDAESLERALAGCACVQDWDQDRAAQWWRASRVPSPFDVIAKLGPAPR